MVLNNEKLDMVAQLKAEVCESLRINEDRYLELHYESGCLFLEKKYEPALAALMQSHPLFWAWWKVEYTLFDREYLKETRNNLPLRTQAYYIEVHTNMQYRPSKRIFEQITETATNERSNKSVLHRRRKS